MSRILGYTDRASVEPGTEIACHVSLVSDAEAEEAEFTAKVVRVVGVDDSGAERFEPVAAAGDRRHVARVEETSTGSYGIAELALPRDALSGLTLEVTFMPTLFQGRAQGLISVCETDSERHEEVALAIDAARRPVLLIGGAVPGLSRVVLPAALGEGRWYRMSGGFRSGEAFASVSAVDDSDFAAAEGTVPIDAAPEIEAPTTYLACRPSHDGERLRLGDKFTGRLEDPTVAIPAASGDGRGQVVARWDLGKEPASFTIHDASGNGNDGQLFGVPIRAVTGSNWDRRTTSVHDAPEQYRAIHFLADAIEDAGWPQAFSFRVPAETRSGLYAFVLQTEDDRDTVPFVVGPSRSSPGDILVILPTATYLAYSNARFMWERVNWEVQRERSVELGRGERMLLDHPEFGASSYDEYRDGTNIAHVSWRRPNLDMRADQCRGEGYPSDLRLIDWLERRGYRYDVCADGDLDRDGLGLLGSYRAALTGTHPEYGSSNGYDAIESYLSNGGRLAVLGGDVCTWFVAFSAERPWIMEVRKPDRISPGSRAEAEGHLALTGEFSAAPDGPRPSERFLGTSSASMGFETARPYERLPTSDSPAAEFIFAGVAERMIGDDSPSGGVVHQEWDNTEDVSGFTLADGQPIVLARSTGHSVTTRWFGAGKRRNHAEMTFFTTKGGGAVFSVNSMAWCLRLNRQDVSSITSNVLDRFLDPEPFEPV